MINMKINMKDLYKNSILSKIGNSSRYYCHLNELFDLYELESKTKIFNFINNWISNNESNEIIFKKEKKYFSIYKNHEDKDKLYLFVRDFSNDSYNLCSYWKIVIDFVNNNIPIFFYVKETLEIKD